MSPGHDAKLFTPDTLASFSPTTRKYYRDWQALSSKTSFSLWTGEPRFPRHLLPEELAVAKTEFNAIPELFYATNNWLPVITPENYDEFETVMKKGPYHGFPTLWSWCSGSSHLSLCISSLPFLCAVLFPVDLRYGWDLKRRPRQIKLQRADKIFKPRITSMEPRCKYWSNMGTSRKIQDTLELRQSELPMLKFMTSHAIMIVKDFRDAFLENPRSSSIWTKSPLAAILDHPAYSEHRYNTCMCAFSSEKDGRRNKKDTTLVSSFCLKYSVRRCSCKQGHIHLQGYDPDAHRKRTAAAAMFSRKLCVALCKDIQVLEMKEPGVSINRFSEAYPAMEEEEDDEEQRPAKPSTEFADIEKLMDEFKDIDTNGIKIDLPSFSVSEQQWIKAAILSITDHTLSFGIPGTPTGRILMPPGTEEPQQEGARVLHRIMDPCFTIKAMTSQCYRPELHRFDESLFKDPNEYRDCIVFHGTADGCYNMQVNKDWRTTAKDEAVSHSIFIIVLLGIITSNLLLDQLQTGESDQRRRLRGKQAAPEHYRSSKDIVAKPGALDITTEDAMEKIEINGRVLSRTRPNLDLRDLPKKLTHANEKDR